MRLSRNAVRCRHCNTVIESVHRHDFRWCNCSPDSTTRIAVDGGHDYMKMSAGIHAVWDDLSEWVNNDNNEEN